MESLPEYIYKTTLRELPIGLMGLKVTEVRGSVEEHLNNMAERGWEFMQMSFVPASQNTVLFIFRKPVTSVADLDR